MSRLASELGNAASKTLGFLFFVASEGTGLARETLESVAERTSVKLADSVHCFVLENLATFSFMTSVAWGITTQAFSSMHPFFGGVGTLVTNSLVSIGKIYTRGEFKNIKEAVCGELKSRFLDFESSDDVLVAKHPEDYERIKASLISQIHRGAISYNLAHVNTVATALIYTITTVGHHAGFNVDVASRGLYIVLASTLAAHTYHYHKKS